MIRLKNNKWDGYKTATRKQQEEQQQREVEILREKLKDCERKNKELDEQIKKQAELDKKKLTQDGDTNSEQSVPPPG